MLPEVPFAACLALGAVVAPPDAVAATAVARRIGLPRRVVTILEGESLVNDATALVLLPGGRGRGDRPAVGAGEIAVEVLPWPSAAGSWSASAARWCSASCTAGSTDPLLDNALSLLTPFAVAFDRRVDTRLGRGRGAWSPGSTWGTGCRS